MNFEAVAERVTPDDVITMIINELGKGGAKQPKAEAKTEVKPEVKTEIKTEEAEGKKKRSKK